MSTGVPFVGRPITTTGAAARRELAGVRIGEVQRREDQPVDVAVLEVAHHRELVLGVRARRVQHQPAAARLVPPPGSTPTIVV